jgi:hypothetical protein
MGDGCAVIARVRYSTEILDLGARKFLNPYLLTIETFIKLFLSVSEFSASSAVN